MLNIVFGPGYWFSHKSGSSLHGLWPILCMKLAQWLLQVSQSGWRPWNVVTMSAVLSVTLPNSEPSMVHTLSNKNARTYAFKMSAPNHSSFLHKLLLRKICHVVICHQPSFLSEVLDLGIKDHITFDKLVSKGNLFAIWKYFKWNHFFSLQIWHQPMKWYFSSYLKLMPLPVKNNIFLAIFV